MPLAFALVIIAGLSTCIGAAVVFVPALVKLANKRVLAGSLGISSGVMLYVSFVEIFVKSLDEFKIVMNHDGHAALVATGTFFGGIVFMFGLGQLVACMGHSHDDEAGIDDCCDVDKALATPKTGLKKKRKAGGVLVEPTRDPAELKNNPALDVVEEKVASGTALACAGAHKEVDIESGGVAVKTASAQNENPQGDPMETTLTEDLSDPSNARKVRPFCVRLPRQTETERLTRAVERREQFTNVCGSIPTAHCTMHDARCTMHDARCAMRDARTTPGRCAFAYACIPPQMTGTDTGTGKDRIHNSFTTTIPPPPPPHRERIN